jgi:hypothetical protein
LSTRDKKYFPIDFGKEKGLNSSIIPHPLMDDTWIIVAQQNSDDESSLLFSELVCNAEFENGRLV